MPNIKCKICGTEFPALVERHYIARDLTKTGLAAAFGSSDEPAMFDAFDCPNCGCQVIAQQRKRSYNPETVSEALHEFLSEEEKDDEEEREPASLYFNDPQKAALTLGALKEVIEKQGFLSIADANKILGGEADITSKWGWSDLSKAQIISLKPGRWFISFPAVTNIPVKEGS